MAGQLSASRGLILLACALQAGACTTPSATASLAVRVLPALPVPVANNAVASVTGTDGVTLYSFLGLGAGKTHADITARAFALAPGAAAWRELQPVPGARGRLAATAVAVGEYAYVFGGYTVAADASEKSIAAVHRIRGGDDHYEAVAPMPVPVDDAVSVVYANRYIYLVSGWHDSGNVNLVQLFDTATGMWRQATPYPGTPVFGHAGGLVDASLVVCDGVKIVVTTGQRKFAAAGECYRGDIRAHDPARIDWTTLPAHPGVPRYRMAAGAQNTGARRRIVFAGGSDNPYNFNGVGYDGVASAPADAVFAFDLDAGWVSLGRLPVASMDHRGLLALGDELVIVGGMRGAQEVAAEVVAFAP